jgi:predicted RNA-binding Zn-ribbon protein involved in translation (DUF1610 family)
MRGDLSDFGLDNPFMENTDLHSESTASNQYPCTQCGAMLHFAPGTLSLKCPYCSHENPIARSEQEIAELDYLSYLERESQQKEIVEELRLRCDQCGAETTLPENVTSGLCPFCSANQIASTKVSRLIQPEALLPFKVTIKEAFEAFRRWIRGLWFAPGELSRYAQSESKLSGIYVPCWTFDSATTSDYHGERGDYHYTTESFQVTENGRRLTRTRQVRHTRWSAAQGRVQKSFDDILILASRSLPKKYAALLEPWDLENLVPYKDEYLSGFRAESYQVTLGEGFKEAEAIMAEAIRECICRHIGGDEQRIHAVQTRHEKTTFKHVLLPVWMSAYRFRGRIFRILINARTGEVSGERPYSAWKIAGAVIAVLAVGAIIAWIASASG